MSIGRRRRGGLNPGGGFSPKAIPGLVFWADASYITGLNDGDSVTTWNDLSGNDNHATQSTAAQKPILKLNIINGRPVVRFDATDDNLVITNGGTLFQNKPGGIVIAVVAFNLTGNKQYLAALTPAGAGRIIGAASPGYRILDTDGFTGVTFPTLSTGTFYVLSLVINATAAQGQGFRNGTAGSIASGGTAGNFSDTSGLSTTLGVASTATLNGDLATIVMYDRVLTTIERVRIERYFGSRYGITVL